MTSEFIDTNVLIYAFSEDEPQKSDLANELIFEGNRIISLQVINEFSNICLRKFKKSPQTVSAAILEIAGRLKIVNFDLSTQFKALSLCRQLTLYYYDALIIATALQNNCSKIFSEDMQHNQIIEGTLNIINPFIPL